MASVCSEFYIEVLWKVSDTKKLSLCALEQTLSIRAAHLKPDDSVTLKYFAASIQYLYLFSTRR